MIPPRVPGPKIPDTENKATQRKHVNDSPAHLKFEFLSVTAEKNKGQVET